MQKQTNKCIHDVTLMTIFVNSIYTARHQMQLQTYLVITCQGRHAGQSLIRATKCHTKKAIIHCRDRTQKRINVLMRLKVSRKKKLQGWGHILKQHKTTNQHV